MVLETRPSSKTDYHYIKSAMDFFYVERSYKITPIYAKAKNKSELMRCEKQINANIRNYPGKSVVVLCADYDRDGDSLTNQGLVDYCASRSYELVWMNRDVEEVFLKRRVPDKE